MNLHDFISTYNGKSGIGDTPENEGECVGLVEVWTDSLGQPHDWGNADDLMANADRSAYDVIPNTPDNFPPPGDIICWGAGWEGSPVGHTAIVVNADVNAFEVLEQNDRLGGGDGRVRLYTFNTYDGVQGWIHPKVLDQSNQGNSAMQLDLARARVLSWGILGRNGYDGHSNALNGEADADLNAYHVGKDPYAEIWDFYKSPEGQDWIGTRLPAVYKRVSDLSAQIQSQQSVIDALNAHVTSLQQTAASTPTGTVPPAAQPTQPMEANSTSLNSSVNTTDDKPAPVKEASKSTARIAVFGLISYGVTFALDTVVPGLPKNETTVALTLVLRFVDSYIHNNPKTDAKGLLPF